MSRRAAVVAALATLAAAAPALGQHREYYVQGAVVDTAKKPVPGVAIRLRDVATSRAYHLKTDKDGVFKFAGLPHGVYEVTVEKDGYASRTDEWRFQAQQDRMQKVQVPEIVLASQAQVETAERLKAADSDVRRAGEKLQQGDLDGALALVQGVLARSPDHAHALFLLGLGYARKKMYGEAVTALTRVTELTPSLAGAWFELGVCYRAQGERERALASYDKALALDPAHADAAYNSGLILFEASRIDEALARFQQGLAIRAGDTDLLEMAARCHLHRAEYEPALGYLQKARAGATDPAKIAFLDGLIERTRAQVAR